jgi:hypothetical protein
MRRKEKKDVQKTRMIGTIEYFAFLSTLSFSYTHNCQEEEEEEEKTNN